MMRLRTYASFSLVASLAVIYHAFSTRGQFYPAMVYLSSSKVCLLLVLNMGLVIMCIFWQLIKRLFLGSLREAEVERLNEQLWREIMEILFAITIFRQDFSVSFLSMVTALLFVKTLHWMAQKRVEYIETTPSVSRLSHIRIVSFMKFLLLLDSLFLYNTVKHMLKTQQPSVSVFFSFEYVILVTTTVSTLVKYVFYVSDMLMEGQWERKAMYTFYLELFRDLLHLFMYMCFFFVIFMYYGVPLHLIRELHDTFRNFRIRLADFIRYRKITSNMKDRFPDATPEELTLNDATCIICREEMTSAKKLTCGHLFHVHCLRSWLERQHTCPTCRATVLAPENGASVARGQRGSHSDSNQQETGIGSGETGGPADADTANRLDHHQTRIQAAAAAASIYEKSYVYPYASTLVWSPGYAVQSKYHAPAASNSNTVIPEEMGASARQPHQQFATCVSPSNSLSQFRPSMFVPTWAPLANVTQPERQENVLSCEMDSHRRFLQCQIEALQSQLDHLKTLSPRHHDRNETAAASNEERAADISPSLSDRDPPAAIQRLP